MKYLQCLVFHLSSEVLAFQAKTVSELSGFGVG